MDVAHLVQPARMRGALPLAGMHARTVLIALLLIVIASLVPGLAHAQDEEPEPPPPLPPVESPLEHLEAPCAEGDGAKCLEAGLAWHTGQIPDGSPANHPKAVNFFQAACAFGVVEGCLRAAKMYLDREAGVLVIMPAGTAEADLGAAAEQLKFACDLGHVASCGRMGDIYVNPTGAMEGAFRGVEQDYFYAAQAYGFGCNERYVPDAADVRPDGRVDARSCARLGELHERGAGVMRNGKLALNYYDRACRAGAAAWCAKADAIKQALADGTWTHPDQATREDRPDPGRRGDGHLGSIRPDTERFEDPALGIDDRKREAGVRLDFAGMIGSRWFYGPPRTLGGINFKAGLTVWAKLIGFGLESGFNTDRLFVPSGRYYARYTHAFVVKGIFPLPVKLPLPAMLALGVGAGPLFGHQRFEEVPFFPFVGAREHIQIVISSPQRRGARQWGAFRVEQQQTWLGAVQRLEHSTQIMFLFGFTAGGVAPEYPNGKGRVKEDDITNRDAPRPNWD